MKNEVPKDSFNRIITSFQSTGRIGRSTITQALISWLGYAGIEFSAIDADGEHRTLSAWYPGFTVKRPYRSEEDLLPILNETGNASAQLIDYPAQETQSILRAFEHFDAFALFEKKKTKLTILIFASDERAAMTSAAQIITSFEAKADYVIVKNPARFTSEIFEHSKLPTMLKEFNAPTVEVPRITGATLEALDAASRTQKKALTFREAEALLPIGSTFELQNWRNRLFAQFEDIAHVLVGSPELVKNKVRRVKQPNLAKIDPFDL